LYIGTETSRDTASTGSPRNSRSTTSFFRPTDQRLTSAAAPASPAVALRAPSGAHVADLARGLGEVPLPQALAGECPKAGYLWAWQFVFPSSQHCRDPYTGRTVRFHVHEKTLQRAVKEAARRAGIGKPVGCHTFRHAFATHLLEAGHNIRVVQQLMGHKDVGTTMIYTHVMSTSLAEVRSPADTLVT
jgi:integrase